MGEFHPSWEIKMRCDVCSADGAADIRSSLQHLMTLFSRKLFNDSLPPVALKHQLYSLHSDKTSVDKQVVRSASATLCKKKRELIKRDLIITLAHSLITPWLTASCSVLNSVYVSAFHLFLLRASWGRMASCWCSSWALTLRPSLWCSLKTTEPKSFRGKLVEKRWELWRNSWLN